MPELPTLFLIDVDPQDADGVLLVDDEPKLVRELGIVVSINMRLDTSSWDTLDAKGFFDCT